MCCVSFDINIYYLWNKQTTTNFLPQIILSDYNSLNLGKADYSMLSDLDVNSYNQYFS